MKPRISVLMSMVLVAVASFGLYLVKYRVQAVQDEIVNVSKQIDDERESLHVASAEWAYLNRPERIQHLSEKYLHLQPMKTTQTATLDALPSAPPPQGKHQPIIPASTSAAAAMEEE